ncbi:hypothetical protein SKAU_G00298160 [Synaphobranchus kaupii]|uniref:Uncharacterized protein n=1 Tax=Synaphobranchus kaupii TaxID=118154 RepID=A0A9Q1EV31_SYNKA|nr:hypothetical protein SKAU_G00298150 [Synaphobranchus kaupii]KAJ8345623.1 hypothetical protein SKAU_G00298160 [Synaphobranchus kaupii]
MNTSHARGNVSEEEEEQVYANVESFDAKDDKEKEEDDSGSEADYENCSQPLETEYQIVNFADDVVSVRNIFLCFEARKNDLAGPIGFMKSR